MQPVNPRGLYVITPDLVDAQQLVRQVAMIVRQGVDVLQLRIKSLPPSARRAVAHEVQALCIQAHVPLIVNDDLALAHAVGAAGVHLGQSDTDPSYARQVLGPHACIGVSCYNDLDRAQALSPWANYLALGSVFASPTKPQAPRASLACLASARVHGRAIVAIGGIHAHNAAQVIEAGADAVAVLHAIFSAPDPAAATRALHHIVHAALAQRAAGPLTAP